MGLYLIYLIEPLWIANVQFVVIFLQAAYSNNLTTTNFAHISIVEKLQNRNNTLEVSQANKTWNLQEQFLLVLCRSIYVSHTCIQSSCHVLKDLQKYFFRNNNTCTFINWCFILKLSNVVKCFPWKWRKIIIVSYNEIPNHGCCLI